jgi:FlaA1/EpsC-like NDP-sugar epimerase
MEGGNNLLVKRINRFLPINDLNSKRAIRAILTTEDVKTVKLTDHFVKTIHIEDLLGRPTVELNLESIHSQLANKVILITGAGGSIGSEISRQVCRFHPKKILLFGHGEHDIFNIDRELREVTIHTSSPIDIVPIIGDIQDQQRVNEVMEEHQPHVVYHAAAHKHVPLMEFNPKEAIKNNVIGTKNVAEAADHFQVETFVLISSDKAVNPTSVMGATKRLAEMTIQHINNSSTTKFLAVRFGNVLGSSGSVIPLFIDQIEKGGPVQVTHPDMTRYFMTIPEASQLVIQSGAIAKGGEIFVLDMGDPIKIVDLAKNLIQLAGFTEDDIGIEFIGQRPGEKMYEELLNEDEVYPEQIFPKIYIGKAKCNDYMMIDTLIKTFKTKKDLAIKTMLLHVALSKPDMSKVQ